MSRSFLKVVLRNIEEDFMEHVTAKIKAENDPASGTLTITSEDEKVLEDVQRLFSRSYPAFKLTQSAEATK